MSLVGEIVSWFLHGRAADQPTRPAVPEIPRAASPKVPPKPVDPIDFRRIAESSARSFLDELRSLQPAVSAFERARTDLVDELRRLARAKTNGRAPDRR